MSAHKEKDTYNMRYTHISRLAKERYLKKLSEDEFRDKVVRPLFLRLGFTDGRDLCGPTEFGRDAIFSTRDEFGARRLVGVQTKKGSLNLASQAKDSLISAETQLNTALKVAYRMIDTKHNEFLSAIYLCTSGAVNEAARAHINDQLQDSRVRFLDANDLISSVDENFPELWLGIESDLTPYLKAIAKAHFGDEQRLAQLPLLLPDAFTEDRYVDLRISRQTPRLRRVRGKVEQVPRFEDRPATSLARPKSNLTLLCGDPGSGKSTVMKRIAVMTVTRALENDLRDSTIPVFIRATDLARESSIHLLPYAEELSRKISGGNRSAFSKEDIDDGKLLILIDALDEVASDSARQAIVTAAREFATECTKCSVVLTSRPYSFLSSLPGVEYFERWDMSSLGWKSACDVLDRALTQKKISPSVKKETLRKIHSLHGIELSPLMVTVFATAVSFDATDIPANITELFKKFTELALGRWDASKGLGEQFQAPLKDFALCKLAFEMHVERKTRVSRSAAMTVMSRALAERGHESSDESLLKESIDRSGLFRIDGEDIEFRHHLFQEFFAGRGVEKNTNLAQLASDSWWRRPLVFYFGQRPDSVDELIQLMSDARLLERPAASEVALTTGLALQACYLGLVTQKIEVWKACAEELARASLAVRNHPELKEHPILSSIMQVLEAKDSVALSHLIDHYEAVAHWCDNHAEPDMREKLLFWLVTALMEHTNVSPVVEFLRTKKITDPLLLIGLDIQAHVCVNVKAVDTTTKSLATEVLKLTEHTVAHLREKLLAELKSLNLEHNGEKIVDVT